MDIGAALRQVRLSAGLTQRELAGRAGVAAASVSRYESGVKVPSFPFVERVLATCGKDLHLVVVERYSDLEATFAALAATPLRERRDDTCLSRPSFLESLSGLPGRVHVGGSWAAVLGGVPTEPAEGRLLVADDDATVAGLTSLLFRFFARLVIEERVSGVLANPRVVRYEGGCLWAVQDVGRFTTGLVPPDGPWPPAQPVPTPRGTLHVTPPDALVAVEDGVRPDVLARWRDWHGRLRPAPTTWDGPG